MSTARSASRSAGTGRVKQRPQIAAQQAQRVAGQLRATLEIVDFDRGRHAFFGQSQILCPRQGERC